MKRATRRGAAGFTLLEVTLVLVVGMAIMGVAHQYTKQYADGVLNQAAAQHQKLVADATAQYIKDNYAAVAGVATPSTPATLTVATLKATGYLPASFSELNGFNHAYDIRVLEPTPNKLDTLIVTTGGETVDDMNVRRVANLVGAKGGFVSSSNAAVAEGAFGGWQTPVATFGVSPGGGHLATALFFEDGTLASDYLYRNAVPGRPDLNRMNTAIDMGSHNLNNAGQVNASSAAVTTNVTAGGNVTASGAVAANSATINTNVNAGGTIAAGGNITSSATVQGVTIAASGNVTAGNTMWAANGISTPGNITAGANLQGLNVYAYGRVQTNANDWGLLAYGAGGAANAQPKNAIGSAYVNDLYLRATGKWASQMGSGLNSGQAGTYCQPGNSCGRSSANVLCFYSNDGLYYVSYGAHSWKSGSGSFYGGSPIGHNCGGGVFFIN